MTPKSLTPKKLEMQNFIKIIFVSPQIPGQGSEKKMSYVKSQHRKIGLLAKKAMHKI